MCNNALFPFYFRKPELRTCRHDYEDPTPGFEQFLVYFGCLRLIEHGTGTWIVAVLMSSAIL